MIDQDFKTIVSAFKENLFFYEGLPEPNDDFPAINFFSKGCEETYKGEETETKIFFEAKIFAPWPSTCVNFEDVLIYTKEDVIEYKKILRTFIRYLVSKFGYQFSQRDRFVYDVINYKVTEHDYIAVRVKGALYESGIVDCCEDERFDQNAFQNSNIKRWGY